MKDNRCFAHKPHKSYNPKGTEFCYVMYDVDSRAMRVTGKCDTVDCPFYKPNRSQRRVGDLIRD